MSKRHAASRRRTYGRRQHELVQRRDRDLSPERDEAASDELEGTTLHDSFGFDDLRQSRLTFATGG